MATKTFKIGEYANGGVITAEVSKTKVTIIGKEWDFSKGSRRGSDQSNAKEFTRKSFPICDGNSFVREVLDFLGDLTTSYHAENIYKWIESKLPANRNYNQWWFD